MRVLIDDLASRTGAVGVADLAELYRVPRLPWLRVNMVSTLDGAANGDSGTSGTINNPADKAVFDELRAQADAIVVGAGTARAEGYGLAAVPLVIVSDSGRIPDRLQYAEPGRVLLVTKAESSGLAVARRLLGADQVIVAGQAHVDLEQMRRELVRREFRSLLCEGGPSLLRDLVAAGVADELCLTVVPTVVGGVHPRIVMGEPAHSDLDLAVLLEENGTLLGRWLVR